MRQRFCLTGIFIFFLCGCVYASPASDTDAVSAVQGWVRTSPRPLGSNLRANINSVYTARDVNGTPLYHVISLDPEGYVICSSDTGIEPILAFSDSGQYEPNSENPLYVLIEKDTRGRLQQIQTQAAKVAGSPTLQTATTFQSAAEAKWNTLRSSAESTVLPMSSGLSSVNDPRVDPFIQSRWDQSTVGGSPCYNYYTPNNYVCGCNNTAWAQVMRYFQYPTRPVGTNSFQIYVDDNPASRNLRGGDGAGGAYRWDLMPLIPSSPSTAERQAIGALCADIGVASGTSYASGGSGAWTSEQDLKNVFFYSNACYSSGQSDLVNAVRPNLDARLPVLLSIWGPGVGHAVVCDGYGFNLNSTYYHLNMGWGGSKDAWYNLPDVDTDWYKFDTISGFMYNIYTNGTGESISGRVLDGLTPVDGAVVSAVGGGKTNSVVTDARGIYALTRLPSSTQLIFTVQKSGMQFGARTIATGLSASYTKTGNAWSNDFYRGLFSLQVSAGTGGGSYTNGALVPITANAPVVGQRFDKWTGDTAYIANINAASTTVAMPSQSISISANLTKPDNLNCTTNSGKITITKYTGSGGAVFIPSTIEGKPVAVIGTNAFSGSNGLISVTISDSVTDIGYEAFSGCSSLTTITVDINNSAYSSVDGVLYNKSQTTFVACPEGKVGAITIPGNVTYLGSYMFSGCAGLTAIMVDTNNSSYSSVDGVLFNKSKTSLIQYPMSKSGSYTIPDSVTSIDYQAFSDCTKLTGITIGNGLTSIGSWTFYNCVGLRNVTILNSVTNIETCAFYYCTNLTSIIIPSNVTRIGDWAFASCSSLTNATIGKGVASVGDYAFYNCRNLKSVYFRGAAPSLGGSSVFSGDTSATIYYLPGATGITNPWGGRPTVLWNPRIQTSDSSFGVQSNRFGFNITGTNAFVVTVEACTNLTSGVWESLQTGALSGGRLFFSDVQSTNYPGRFYRLRMP